MAKNQRVVVGVLLAAAVAGSTFLVLQTTEPSAAAAQGVDWQDLTIREALARAESENKRVLVKFDAEWCSYCRQLDEEVLSTAEGAALFEDLIAVSFDFDAEENRPLVEQYVVLGLPTSLVLTPDGTQVARILGYHDRDQWMADLNDAKSAEDPVPALRAAYDAAPANPNATLRLGEALLVRGSPEEGEMLLERAAWISTEAPEAGAEALFILGRYYHRVRRDPRTARHVWRELAARHPDSDWAGGAWWWYAKAEAEMGQHALGLEVLRARAEANPTEGGIVSEWGEYVVAHDLDDSREAALAALRPVAEAATGDDREELIALARQLDGEATEGE